MIINNGYLRDVSIQLSEGSNRFCNNKLPNYACILILMTLPTLYPAYKYRGNGIMGTSACSLCLSAINGQPGDLSHVSHKRNM